MKTLQKLSLGLGVLGISVAIGARFLFLDRVKNGNASQTDVASSNGKSGSQHVNPIDEKLHPASIRTGDPDQESLDELPPELREICGRLIKTNSEANAALAEIIRLAWKDFPSAHAKLRQRMPAEQVEAKAAYVAGLIGSARLERFQECIVFVSEKQEIAVATASVTHSWAQKDPLRLFNYAVSEMSGPIRETAIKAASEALSAGGDYRNAVNAAERLRSSDMRNVLAGRISAKWFEHDPRDCLAWIATISDRKEMHEISGVVAGVAVRRLTSAELVEIANATQDDDSRRLWTYAVAAKLAKKDIGSAEDWVRNLPADVQSSGLMAIADHLSETNTAGATQVALRIKNSDAGDLTLDGIWRQEKMRHGFRNAAEWALRLPVTRMKRQLNGSIVGWYLSNPTECKAWVDSLPNGSNKDLSLMLLESASRNENRR